MRRTLLAGLVAVALLPLAAAPGYAGGERERKLDEMTEVAEGLERGYKALVALGKNDLAKHVLEILKGLEKKIHQERRGEGERAPTEREIVERHLEILRVASHAFREAEKPDAGDRMEHAIHAHELRLEGRRDREAIEIIESAPPPGAMAELLHFAGEIWAELGHEKKAGQCRELSGWYKQRIEREKKDRGKSEREVVKHQIEILGMAAPVLREEERKDLVELVERAIHARELALSGRRDDEARRIRESAPDAGQLAEILILAGKLWKKHDQEDKAHACIELGEHFAGIWRRQREKGEDRERGGRREADSRLERMQDQLAELWEVLERLAREIEEVRREIR